MKPKALLAVLALALVLAACAPPLVDPGPNPARLVVAVQRSISPEALQSAMERRGPFPGRAARLDNFLGPFWDIQAEMQQEDGTWLSLPLAPGQKGLLAGQHLVARRVFLAPPGEHQLRLRLEAHINRSWQEQEGDPYIYRKGPDGTIYRDYDPRWRTKIEAIYLLDQKATRKVTLQAGRETVLSPFNPGAK